MEQMASKYLEELRKRARTSKIYRKYQLLGLEIATALGDDAHKALYMKLAKQGNGEWLLTIAKDVAQKKNVDNKGAYFMAIIQKNQKEKKQHARRNTHRRK